MLEACIAVGDRQEPSQESTWQEPDCSELVAELQMVQAWLPALASTDEDIDIDLAEGRGSVFLFRRCCADLRKSLRSSE